MVASVVWSARPQLLSLVWTALVGLVLFRYKWRGQEQVVGAADHFYPVGQHPWRLSIGIDSNRVDAGGETLNHMLGIQSGAVLAWRQIVRLGHGEPPAGWQCW